MWRRKVKLMYRRLYQPGGHKEEKITQTVATQLFHDMHFIQGIINALDTALELYHTL